MRRLSKLILLALLFANGALCQPIFYIDASLGSDSYSGTISQPFKTISKGLSALGSNIGTIYLRGGTHFSMSKISLTKSGQANQYIKIWAYQNEKVVVDFTGTTSDGFSISGSFYHIKGLDVRKAGHNGINISGNNNIIENCITQSCGNTGLHLTGSAEPGPSNNLILNCDSFYNFDSPIGGNADGFSAKWTVGSGNIFRGCRAWNNSDDGWDLWMCTGSILIDSCYAFRNGIDIWHTGQVDGNGNGIKLGGNNVATPHIVRNSVAFDNAGNGGKGFDENNNLAGQTLYNCTSFRNQSYNFALYNNPLTTGSHIVKNCISYLPGKADVVINAYQEKNSWIGFTFGSADFVSLDTTGCTATRDVNGRIQSSNFLRLNSGSVFIDAGVNVGIPFSGTAPDLGAFEFGYIPSNIGDNKIDSNHIYNFPNPFSSETTVVINSSKGINESIEIYNSLGKTIASYTAFTDGNKPSKLTINTQSWEKGTYLCRIVSQNSSSTIKMIKL